MLNYLFFLRSDRSSFERVSPGEMQAKRLRSRVTCFAFSLAFLFFSHSQAQSQTEPFLNRFQGSWQGDGKAFGTTANLRLSWDWVLRDKFLRLNLKNTMKTQNGQTQVFEGHAYYRTIGPGKYEAKWFDSRGVSFPIQAESSGDTLIAWWGTPEQEQGKSTYRIMGPGKMEVIDSVRQKDGSWKEFGRFLVSRE